MSQHTHAHGQESFIATLLALCLQVSLLKIVNPQVWQPQTIRHGLTMLQIHSICLLDLIPSISVSAQRLRWKATKWQNSTSIPLTNTQPLPILKPWANGEEFLPVNKKTLPTQTRLKEFMEVFSTISIKQKWMEQMQRLLLNNVKRQLLIKLMQ